MRLNKASLELIEKRLKDNNEDAALVLAEKDAAIKELCEALALAGSTITIIAKPRGIDVEDHLEIVDALIAKYTVKEQ